ncbi:alpha/beta-hydrolase [Athelia psychrophila]|uniref:Alpha/beta-hydrolase n=1 Tax=Athelia psychrophila TaxID=1759441 RepID=A0A167X5V7_9AGAM|nr:alpha/beta-hydrolase [Fibularhizoctonia sp. CBS 109695]
MTEPLRYSKTTIQIPSHTPGWHLDVWQYLPVPSSRPAPVIIMAHGLTANKLMGLAPYAEAFASVGYACMAFDYRRWGASEGTPRSMVVVKEQLEDYRTVVKYARHDPAFDPQRVILFGTSFSGGHVITLSAEPELNIKATIAQCPYTGSTPPPPVNLTTVKQLSLAFLDAVKQLLGMAPLYILAATDPGSGRTGLLVADGAEDGLHALGSSPGDFPNEVSASSLLQLPAYDPSSTASRISSPLLIVAPKQDNLCLLSGAQKVVSMIPDAKGELIVVEGDHFSAYPGRENFERSKEAQVEFLKRVVPVSL